MSRPLKLQGEAQAFTIALFAQQKTLGEIKKLLKDIHDIDINKITLGLFSKKMKIQIEDLKNSYLEKSIEQVPIANEYVRLQREELLYKVSQKLSRNTERIDYGLKVLREAREETDKKQEVGTAIQFNQFNQLTDEELLDKKKKMESRILELSKTKEGEYAEIKSS